MINKEIVEKIISENNATKSEQISMDIKNVSVENLKWANSRIALRDFIANLPAEDIVDLLVLMEYSRELYNMKNENINLMEFIKRRKNFGMQINSVDEKKHKASYLLQNTYLSEYLQYSLKLFENVDFNF